jgi:hypothetical protein
LLSLVLPNGSARGGRNIIAVALLATTLEQVEPTMSIVS